MKRLDDLLQNRVSVGKIVKPHGLDGEIKFYPFINDEEFVFSLDEVLLHESEKKEFLFSKVENIRPLNKMYIFRLQGVDNIYSAEKIKGYEVYVPYENLPDTGNDEYYFYELENCQVFYSDGELVGQVKEVIDTGANDIIVVEKKISDYEKEEVLYPISKEFVEKIDKEKKVIIVKKMEFYEDETEDKD